MGTLPRLWCGSSSEGHSDLGWLAKADSCGEAAVTTGSNPQVCVAKPSVVHFGGFELHRPHRQMFRIMNSSLRTQRFTIHESTTKYFKARMSKLGAVAPGMWEEMTIEFTPDEHRYYYDSIRVVTESSDPVVVPIHAYPVVNTADFPTAIDFGKCSITETMSKVVPLSSSVPIEFEFELKVVKPSPFFDVSPLQGIIPANGKVDITIDFHPLQYHSAQMNAEINISQYDFEPFVCTLTGAGAPDSSSSEPLPLTMSPLTTHKVPTMKRTRKSKIKRPIPPPIEKSITVEGILMPPLLDCVHAVSGVLTSQPGKLKLKDLKAALAEQSNAEGQAPGRQMLEAVFNKTLADEVARERNVEIRPALPDCEVATWGFTLQTVEEIETLALTRANLQQAAVNAQRAEGRQRSQTEATDEKPVHNAKATPAFYKPSWDLEGDAGEADASPALQQMRQYLVGITGGLMMQSRTDARISSLRAHLASFQSKEEIASAIGSQREAAQEGETEANAAKNFAGVPTQPALPQFKEQELGAPDAVKSKDLCSFDDRTTAPLEVPKYFELMGYSPLKQADVPAFVTKETSKLLENGAEEEDLVRGWRPAIVRPANTMLNSGPPGALMSHAATVIQPMPRQPVHTVPDHCREPLPCESLLGPVAPDTTVSSLQEACGSNAVLAMWQLPTIQDVQDHSSIRISRPWFDDMVPTLLSGPTADMANFVPEPESADAEESEAASADVTADEGEAAFINATSNIANPHQEAAERLAQQVVDIRVTWSDRLAVGLTQVNDMIVNPDLTIL